MDTTASALTISAAQTSNGINRFACRSRVGDQLNCALPKRLPFNLTVESAPSFPSSRLRLSQKIFSACIPVKRPLNLPAPGERRASGDN